MNPQVVRLTVRAPEIARAAQAGQFVSLMPEESSERIPLTLAHWSRQEGTIDLIFQTVGATTRKLAKLREGQGIAHILGPLGHPTEVRDYAEVVCIGGGVGIAEVYPVIEAMKAAGNRVIGIIGARTKELLILEELIRPLCDEFFVTTDDGSAGSQGLVTDVLRELFSVMERSTHTRYPGLVYCIGPVAMMKAVAEITRGCGVKTVVSLNPIMVDATGMCGSCRCTVAGKTVFGCVDGPDFDAHQVDFDELQHRLAQFKEQEKAADR